ncbi:MAG: S8 family serine peptidase [Saprospiraceae bacterium]|nr:S8 family serine peptidase [Saprospiraceae bacterium]MCF8248435.1 S8 family serine peptidase [Saprospiraceae bacterium]MCF8281331.1 S8 family serine peptidase [Bacteroidales bacterium]MCF8309963.1 S8 family serine peptidase [Saprospiraceae bacterium]MCF8438706.1 S8 family serine peptidase [Saprospiraceae bacterium]
MKYLFTFGLILSTIVISFAQHLDHVQGDLLIQLKPSQSIRETVANLAKQHGNHAEIKIVEELSKPMRIWLLRFDHYKINGKNLLTAARSHPEIENAQFNHFLTLRETTPNDPSFNAQWQWVNTGASGGTADADVDADLAWDITTGGATADGKEIVVCVMEGTNRNHPDLQGNLWFNTLEIPANGIDDDNNGYVDDYNGWNATSDNDNIPSASHGTQVSGMIGAKGNNGQFVTGINWDVKIMHVLVGSLTDANVVKAYTYPFVQRRLYNQSGGTEGAFVVATNASWGLDGGNPADAPLWCAFYDSLGMVGILSCGATANNNVNIDQVLDLPTACPSEFMVAVTATNNKDVRTFSGYGTTHIDVAAPGGDIVTLSTNGGPTTVSGTSFASPITAGIIALLYSAPCSIIGEQAISDPAGTALLIRDAIYNGVDIIPNLVNETKYGGRVNAFNSLNLILQNCGPCPKAYNVATSDILDVSATATWSSTDSTLQSNLRYRPIGSPDWLTVDSISSPFSFTSLQACTGYEFQLEEICSSDSSGYSNSYFFTTDGCCLPPSNFSVAGITTNSAMVSWDTLFAANSYNLQLIGPQGSQLITDINGSSYDLVNLDICGAYTVQVQTVCDTGATAFTEPIIFTTLGCGGCLDLVYCPSMGATTLYEWIANVTINGINNTSTDDNGYGDYTSVSTYLMTYTSNIISLSPGYAGATYPEWFVVYLDFNQDGDFNDPGEKAFDAGAVTETTLTGNIVIPGDALLGSTRMRVVMQRDAQPAGPCAASFAAGEVEDYCINIVAGTAPNCLVPSNIIVFDTTMTSAKISWDAVADANDYTLRYRKVGITGWTTKIASANNLDLDPLEFCKEYEVQVSSNCTGTASDYSGSIFFSTLCVSGTKNELAAELNLSVSPNPFEEGFMARFTLNEAQKVRFEISDVWGRKLHSQEQFSPSGMQEVKLSPTLSSGVYFLKMELANGLLIQKIIKQ